MPRKSRNYLCRKKKKFGEQTNNVYAVPDVPLPEVKYINFSKKMKKTVHR